MHILYGGNGDFGVLITAPCIHFNVHRQQCTEIWRHYNTLTKLLITDLLSYNNSSFIDDIIN